MSNGERIRLKKIVIRSSDAIDQIKFIYSDGKVWCVGQDCGRVDDRVAILTEAEYLVRVSHEKFYNYHCAGSAIEFETNMGRIFSYSAAKTTSRASEKVTFIADQGYEIIELNIRKGVLHGIEQQLIEETSNCNKISKNTVWFSIVSFANKEDEDNPFQVKHFKTCADAKQEWKIYNAGKKLGHGSVLINCLKMTLVKKHGRVDNVNKCIEFAIENGLMMRAPSEAVSLSSAVFMLLKVLTQKSDIINFFIVIGLLIVSNFLDLHSKLLTAHVLSMLSTNQSFEAQHWMVRGVCQYILGGASVSVVRTSILLSYSLVKVLESLFDALNIYLHHNACVSKTHYLKMKSFSHVLSLDQSFFDLHTISHIKSSMDSKGLNDLITWNIPYILSLSLKMIMTLYFMFGINFKLASLTTTIFFVIKVALLDPMNRYEDTIHKVQSKLATASDQILSEALNMVTVAKLFNKTSSHIAEYVESEKRYMGNINLVVILRCGKQFISSNIQAISFCSVLYISMTTLESDNLNAASLGGFFLLFHELKDLFGRISWHSALLRNQFGDIERFLDLMKTESQLLDGPDDSHLNDMCGKVEFENVVFDYPSRPNEKVFRGLNLHIEPNKVTAIVGDSGAGKSTLAKLLMRLYDPLSGVIRLDGKDIKEMTVAHLHEHIAIVSQLPELFNTSLKENIAYGAAAHNEDVSDEEIYAAAKLAKCYDFISAFRSGFDTMAGCLGSQLSGGQKQRIAIARAIIRNPKILILDEATSALDSSNEEQVQEALENLMKGKTTIVIAHRLSTIRNADEIICMKGGEVVERGAYEELLQKEGAFFELINKQK